MVSTSTIDQRRWDEFFRWGKRFFPDQSVLDEGERIYKLKASENSVAARKRFLEREPDWFDLAKRGLNVNLVHWTSKMEFADWHRDSPQEVALAIGLLWDDKLNVVNRINGFHALAPSASQSKLAEPALALHMAMGPENFPTYRATQTEKAFELTGFPDFKSAGAERRGEKYQHALRFFDRILQEASNRSFELRDRLDAQGLMWGITYWLPSDAWPESEKEALLRYRE